jgi:hypothetical protein
VYVASATVMAAINDNRKSVQYGGGQIGSLRAYQAFHPNAAIYVVTYRGRTVWLTSKQQAIWHECQKYWNRGKRDTLARIAKVVGCSRATVSRFLRRLDLWRFINLMTVRGRHGGTYVLTRRDPYNETPRRWTMSMRERVRNTIAARIRRKAQEALEPMLARYRQPKPVLPPYWETALQGAFLSGSTGATYWEPI